MFFTQKPISTHVGIFKKEAIFYGHINKAMQEGNDYIFLGNYFNEKSKQLFNRCDRVKVTRKSASFP